jgi:putative transcriptional regulator
MKSYRTTGKRHLKGDVWHDDNGPIPDTPIEWDPPMTDEEITVAALSDPDNPPMSDEQLSRMRRVSRAKFIRHKLGMSREDFANRFRIPLATLHDWEHHRSQPDAAMLAYLAVIEREPEAVERALSAVAAE